MKASCTALAPSVAAASPPALAVSDERSLFLVGYSSIYQLIPRGASTFDNPAIGIPGFSSQVERSPKGKAFATAEDCAAYDPFQLVLTVPKEKLPHIYLDCGTEDRLIASNLEFVKLLTEHKIPFTFAESGGGHTAPYWAREVGHSMAVQYAIIRRNLAAGPVAAAERQ